MQRLRRLTEDGLPELYVALRDRVGTDGSLWVQIRLPMRPNGTTGWVLRRRLGRVAQPSAPRWRSTAGTCAPSCGATAA